MQVALVGFGVVSVIVGCGLLFAAFRELRHRAVMRRMRVSATGAVGPGPVEVTGRAALAKDGRLVRARFGEGEGVLGLFRVQELRKSGKSSKWVTLHEERDAPPFVVDDGSGPVLVDVERAELDLPMATVAESRLGRDPPERVLAYLAERGIAHEGWFGANRRMRFQEALVRVGGPLYVLGVAELAPARGGARYLVQSGGPGLPFLVSTRDERGVERQQLKKAAGLVLAGLLFLVVGAMMGYSGWTSP